MKIKGLSCRGPLIEALNIMEWKIAVNHQDTSTPWMFDD